MKKCKVCKKIIAFIMAVTLTAACFPGAAAVEAAASSKVSRQVKAKTEKIVKKQVNKKDSKKKKLKKNVNMPCVKKRKKQNIEAGEK